MIAALIAALVLQVSGPELPPEDEARAQGLMREVRCMVCAGESVLDSSAPMANEHAPLHPRGNRRRVR